MYCRHQLRGHSKVKLMEVVALKRLGVGKGAFANLGMDESRLPGTRLLSVAVGVYLLLVLPQKTNFTTTFFLGRIIFRYELREFILFNHFLFRMELSYKYIDHQ
jgi:hypothetical protein